MGAGIGIEGDLDLETVVVVLALARVPDLAIAVPMTATAGIEGTLAQRAEAEALQSPKMRRGRSRGLLQRAHLAQKVAPDLDQKAENRFVEFTNSFSHDP